MPPMQHPDSTLPRGAEPSVPPDLTDPDAELDLSLHS